MARSNKPLALLRYGCGVAYTLIVMAGLTPCQAGEPVRPLANEGIIVYRSPDPKRLFCFSPGLARCPNGRLVAVFDLGGPAAHELKQSDPDFTQNRIYTSDDHGQTWTHRGGYNLLHASRPFVAGKTLYVIGMAGDLTITRSDDWGTTWSEPVRLTDGQTWHQAPSNVWYARDHVYLVMERVVYDDVKVWKPSVMAPVLMRAKVADDLTISTNWTFASELVFRDAVPMDQIDYVGLPFFPFDPHGNVMIAPKREMAPPGWLESNVVQVLDPDHYWFDPAGRTFHLLMRAHTGGTGYAALAKVVENPDGSMTTMLESAPSGKKVAFLPLPGGQMKFHIVYDEKTRLYWLLSSQATDSMTRTDRLPADRYNLPNNERHRLQLHFSRNLVDWCFAGIVSIGPSTLATRHYAAMVIDGEDLQILSRSADALAANPHSGNLITFHTVRQFRNLVY